MRRCQTSTCFQAGVWCTLLCMPVCVFVPIFYGVCPPSSVCYMFRCSLHCTFILGDRYINRSRQTGESRSGHTKVGKHWGFFFLFMPHLPLTVFALIFVSKVVQLALFRQR